MLLNDTNMCSGKKLESRLGRSRRQNARGQERTDAGTRHKRINKMFNWRLHFFIRLNKIAIRIFRSLSRASPFYRAHLDLNISDRKLIYGGNSKSEFTQLSCNFYILGV